MVDDFDRFLAEALAPPERDPDRRFVARVQARVAIEERLRSARRAEVRALGLQVVAVLSVAAGLLLLMRSAALSSLAAQAPGVTLLGLLTAFGLVVALLSAGEGRAITT